MVRRWNDLQTEQAMFKDGRCRNYFFEECLPILAAHRREPPWTTCCKRQRLTLIEPMTFAFEWMKRNWHAMMPSAAMGLFPAYGPTTLVGAHDRVERLTMRIGFVTPCGRTRFGQTS